MALAAVIAIACIAVMAGAVLAAQPKRSKFVVSATMNGSKVVSGGDTDGSGEASLTFKKKKDRICYSIKYRKIGTATTGFIGAGATGEEGNVAVTLFSTSQSSPASGCIRAPSKSIVQAIEKTPKDYFVALTNGAFPKGAIRGQLRHTNNK